MTVKLYNKQDIGLSLRKGKKNGTGDEKQGELQIYLQCFIYWIWKRPEVTDKMLPAGSLG